MIIKRHQLFLWLLSQGVRRDHLVSLLRGNIQDPTALEQAMILFEEKDEFSRDHPLVALIGAQLGFTPEQIDAGFAAAATL